MQTARNITGLALAVFAASAAALQSAGPTQPLHPNSPPQPDCGNCHTCPSPAKAEPCLRGCTRNGALSDLLKQHGPDVVLLDTLTELYLPVPFDHRGHADMAQMTGGCTVCHHYTPEGSQHPACRTCHEAKPGLGDIRKPGLKGAYHRQCLSCHREWSDETSCGICHQAKSGGRTHGIVSLPTPDDLVGRMHPPIPEPEIELYRTEREGYPPSKVLFRHKGHTAEYDLQCSDCHREDNCNRCHNGNSQHVQRVRTLDDHHEPCFRCHADDACARCHFEEGQTAPRAFIHADTGWPLSRYHADTSCRKCHSAPPYRAVSNDCNACHAAWSSGTFRHGLTGQVLDETHAALDCQDCHADRKFTAPPTCSSCHDEDENIAFPARRPGPVIPPGPQ